MKFQFKQVMATKIKYALQSKLKHNFEFDLPFHRGTIVH